MCKYINWGILGTARIAKDRFLPGLMMAEHANCYAIAGRKKEKLDEFTKLFQPEVTYTSYEALLSDSKVDAVYIPLPNHLHKEWVCKAARAGKHILCEKPIGLHPGEIEEMTAIAKAHNVILAEAFAYLHSDTMKVAKDIVDSGILGELRHIQVRYQIVVDQMGLGKEKDIRYQPEYGGGVIYDLGCYAISFMRSIYQEEPCDIHVFRRNADSGIDEHVSMNVAFPSGRSASAFLSFDTFYEQSRVIVGEKGRLDIPIPFNAAGKSQYTIKTAQGTEEKILENRDPYALEAEDFSMAILEGGSPLVSLHYSMGNAIAIDSALDNRGGDKNVNN